MLVNVKWLIKQTFLWKCSGTRTEMKMIEKAANVSEALEDYCTLEAKYEELRWVGGIITWLTTRRLESRLDCFFHTWFHFIFCFKFLISLSFSLTLLFNILLFTPLSTFYKVTCSHLQMVLKNYPVYSNVLPTGSDQHQYMMDLRQKQLATVMQSIEAMSTQLVFSLWHNVYIRIKRLQHYCLMALNQIKHLKGSTIKVM